MTMYTKICILVSTIKLLVTKQMYQIVSTILIYFLSFLPNCTVFEDNSLVCFDTIEQNQTYQYKYKNNITD